MKIPTEGPFRCAETQINMKHHLSVHHILQSLPRCRPRRFYKMYYNFAPGNGKTNYIIEISNFVHFCAQSATYVLDSWTTPSKL